MNKNLHTRNTIWLSRLVGYGAMLVSAIPVANAQNPQILEHGRTLLEINCSACHATGKSGQSTLNKAPEFRKLGEKYPLENLSEALAEGIMTGHPDMPQFVFAPADISAILAYLKSIAEQ